MTEYTTASRVEDLDARANAEEQAADVPVALVLLIVSPFILASLIKPRFLESDSRPRELHINVGSTWSRVMGLIIVFVTIITLIALATRPNLVEAAKVFFIMVSTIFATVSWIIVNHHSFLMSELETLELNASEGRDEARSNIQSVRALLADVNKKLGHTTQEEILTANHVLQSLGPLAMMFLKGERNIFKIGFAAAGVASKAMTYFKSSQK